MTTSKDIVGKMQQVQTQGKGENKLIIAMRITAPKKIRLAVLIEMDAGYRAKCAEDGVDLVENEYNFLALSLSVPGCDCSVIYKSPLDIPLDDVICKHGHYLLKWEEPRGLA